MIEKILNKYFTKKLKKYTSSYLLRWYIDIRFIEKNNFIELQIKKAHYKDEFFKSIYSFNKSDALFYLLNTEKTFKELKKCVDYYLESKGE